MRRCVTRATPDYVIRSTGQANDARQSLNNSSMRYVTTIRYRFLKLAKLRRYYRGETRGENKMTLNLSSDACARMRQLWRRVRSPPLRLIVRITASFQNVSSAMHSTLREITKVPSMRIKDHPNIRNVRKIDVTLSFIGEIRQLIHYTYMYIRAISKEGNASSKSSLSRSINKTNKSLFFFNVVDVHTKCTRKRN